MQVIGPNIIYKYSLPEAVCCCLLLQTCNVYILILMMGCLPRNPRFLPPSCLVMTYKYLVMLESDVEMEPRAQRGFSTISVFRGGKA